MNRTRAHTRHDFCDDRCRVNQLPHEAHHLSAPSQDCLNQFVKPAATAQSSHAVASLTHSLTHSPIDSHFPVLARSHSLIHSQLSTYSHTRALTNSFTYALTRSPTLPSLLHSVPSCKCIHKSMQKFFEIHSAKFEKDM